MSLSAFYLCRRPPARGIVGGPKQQPQSPPTGASPPPSGRPFPLTTGCSSARTLQSASTVPPLVRHSRVPTCGVTASTSVGPTSRRGVDLVAGGLPAPGRQAHLIAHRSSIASVQAIHGIASSPPPPAPLAPDRHRRITSPPQPPSPGRSSPVARQLSWHAEEGRARRLLPAAFGRPWGWMPSRRATTGTWPCPGRIGMPAKRAACQHPAGPTHSERCCLPSTPPLAATYPTAGVLFATGPDRLGGGRAGGRQALQRGGNGCNPRPH